MALTKYKLGELISLCDERNYDGKYTLDNLKGISIKKEFIETKADMEGVSLSPYILVRPDSFAYVTVTSRNGEKITLAHNTSENTYIVSSSYVVFRVSRPDLLLSDYLFMFFNRPEFDRYSRYSSWGSARETFSWEDMCDIDLMLPSVETQQKFVDVYNSLLKNFETYQSKIDDLKLICDGYIENLRRITPRKEMVQIGDYISKRSEVNSDGQVTLEQGINIQKQFITPQRENSNLFGRRIVRHGDIAYCTQLNNENVAVAYRDGEDCVVSSVYDIIYVKDESVMLPKYLMLWLVRPEFGRYVYTLSTGSAYEFLSYDDLAGYKIPLPDIRVQQAIVNIYDCMNERRFLAAELKAKLNSLCPVLIQGSIQVEK